MISSVLKSMMAISAAVLVGSMPLIVAENLGVEPIGIVVSDVSVKEAQVV